MRTNRVCAGRVGALFFLSETGMNNSRACHNTPECFISSQHCRKINTSSAIALCFLTCLAAHSDVPCPLVLCPTPFSKSAPHSALISHFLVQVCLEPCRETTAWCEVRCYLSQPSVQGVDIRTGVLLCHCN